MERLVQRISPFVHSLELLAILLRSHFSDTPLPKKVPKMV
jgi:hypothetical protein